MGLGPHQATLATSHPVTIVLGPAALAGELAIPSGARGMVLFAHGSGSGRHSPRNRAVAHALRDAGLATRLIDLLTEEEAAQDARDARLRFNIPFLAERLIGVVDWLAQDPSAGQLPLGLFGASTGAAAALVAAAERPHLIRAIVSRGGRPDLASQVLGTVAAPTLLIVGGNDQAVLELNRRALAALRGEKELVVIAGATHLFPEPGALEEVARVAAQWFTRYLGQHGAPNR
jgi:putative phosphoribosyl transferase